MDRRAKQNRGARQVALVTGSRRGIGLGIAMALAREGFTVVLNGRASPSATRGIIEKVGSLGGRVEYLQADVSVGSDRERLVKTIAELFGRLDILVNNAGVAPESRVDILEATEESFDRLIEVNLKGPYFLTQRVANWMIEQKREDKRRTPKIINISSVSAYTASPSRGEYCISKAGLSMTTALFAVRLAQYGIGVYEIRPGIMETDMTAPVREKYNRLISEGVTPIRRWGTPEDVARAVLAIARDYFPFSTGEVIDVDGGFHLRTL
ncbi:MAG: 3-ketoacyl-ACP reductase [Deltaproteobacteria bacterium]|nr:3-ketoacyl-ACP reductase [Deltaproteobacteria bacterium]